MNDFKKKTTNAVAWRMFAQVAAEIITFVFGIAVARLLVPGDYGLIAMIAVFSGLAAQLSNVGFASALIQKPDPTVEDFSSVFWFNAVIYGSASVILYFSAGAVAAFYNEPRLVPLMETVAILFPVAPLAAVHHISLQRDLNFKAIAISHIISKLVSSIVALIAAIGGLGVWALVLQRGCQSILNSVALISYAKWKPKLVLSFASLRAMFGFGSSLMMSGLLKYAASSLPAMLLGKSVGDQAAGLFNRANLIVGIPLAQFGDTLSNVMFPALSQIQDEPGRVVRVYVRSIGVLAVLVMPCVVGIMTTAERLVPIVFGAQWVDLVFPLQIFCIVGLAHSIGMMNNLLFLSQGKAGLDLRVNLVTQSATIAGMLVGLQWGLSGVVVALAITSTLNLMPSLYFSSKLMKVPLSTFVRAIWNPMYIALTMGGVVHLLGITFGDWSPKLVLVIQIAGGLLVYPTLLFASRSQPLFDLLELIRERYLSSRRETDQTSVS